MKRKLWNRLLVLMMTLSMVSSVFGWNMGIAAETTMIPKPSKTVIVVMENHSYQSIIGNIKAPYMNYLAKNGTLFTQSFAIEHPSQPNYLDLFSGSNQGVTSNDCPNTFSAPNLASELLRTNQTFVGYSEDLPSIGYEGCQSKQYWRKHNPWVNFSNVPKELNQPLTEFPTDYSKLPTVSFIVPNQDNDMHDGTIEQADKWLERTIDRYVKWAMLNNSLLILTWDEDDNTKNNQIPTIFIGPMVKMGESTERVDHFNVLRTLTDMYGLTAMANAAKASAITSVWTDAKDQIAPLAPSGITVSHRSQNQVSIFWKASTDENRVIGYEVFRNGISIGKTATASMTDRIGEGATTATYEVVAMDSAGNRSAKSEAFMLGAWSSVGAQTATIYYRSSEKQYIHYSASGMNWTTLPGYELSPSPVNGYQWIQLWTGNAKGIESAAFHDASNSWNNNADKNYIFANGVYTIDGTTVTAGAPTAPKDPEVTVYYVSTKPMYMHYHIDAGTWTKVPGTAMTATATTNVYKTTIALGTTGKLVEAAFNDGNNNWNNNADKNYKMTAGTYTVENGTLREGLPTGYVLTSDPTPSPTPEPSASPSISPSPSVSPEPSVSPSPSVSPEPSISPSPSVSPEPSVSPSPSVSPEPSVTPSPTPEPTATPTAEPTATPIPTPTETPAPTPTVKPTATPIGKGYKITVYYWTSVKTTASFKMDQKAWAKAPINALTKSTYKGYQKMQIVVPTFQSKAFLTFTTSKGIDNNKKRAYAVTVGSYTIKNGKLTRGLPQ